MASLRRKAASRDCLAILFPHGLGLCQTACRMRIVLTGAAGLIGSHLSDLLLARGDEVVGVDNFLTGVPENLAHLASQPRWQFREHDLVEPLQVKGPVDWVLNLASPASPADYLRHGLETLRVGSLGTQNALELAREKGARFLQASTSECYGDPEVRPQPETYWGNVNPVGPRSVYDEAKRYGEALTMAYHRYSGLDTRIVRIFNTYGPRMKLGDGRVIPNLFQQALSGQPLTVYGDGTQTRSFCYISDLVEGMTRAMARAMERPEHLPINLGNPQEMSILELVRLVQSLTGNRSGIKFRPLPEDDPRHRCPDISRARQLLGWEPRVGLEEGLRLTLEFFRSKVSQRTA